MPKFTNIYKPRYKIAFQAQNKIWVYKNSRLRRFFNIRGRKIIRRGFFKRIVLVLNKMKWTIIRRYIRPAMRSTERRHQARRSLRYRNSFYCKQRLRYFYGKIKEEKFRKYFQQHLRISFTRNFAFYTSLECRLDIFLFRLRVLPTIYSAHQFIHHQGVTLNTSIEKCPSRTVLPGDILSFDKKYWFLFYKYLYSRLFFYAYGKYRVKKRRYKKLKKNLYFLHKRRFLNKWFVRVIHNYYFLSYKIFKQKQVVLLFLKNKLTLLMSLSEKNKKKANPLFLELCFNVKKILLFSLAFKKTFLLVLKQKKHLKAQFVKKKTSKKSYKKQTLVKLLYVLGNLFKYKKNLILFSVDLQLHELKWDYFLLFSIRNKIPLPSLKHLFSTYKNYLLLNYILKSKRLAFLHFISIKYTLGLYIFNTDLIYRNSLMLANKQSNVLLSKKKKMNFIVWALRQKLYKKRKKNQILRFKYIHFYIPKYIHFDFTTLRGVLLYTPKPEQIHYAFQNSFYKIRSFYKSLAN